jgi:hypothetical protein
MQSPEGGDQKGFGMGVGRWATFLEPGPCQLLSGSRGTNCVNAEGQTVTWILVTEQRRALSRWAVVEETGSSHSACHLAGCGWSTFLGSGHNWHLPSPEHSRKCLWLVLFNSGPLHWLSTWPLLTNQTAFGVSEDYFHIPLCKNKCHLALQVQFHLKTLPDNGSLLYTFTMINYESPLASPGLLSFPDSSENG